MLVVGWIVSYLLSSLVCKWIISWGGDEALEDLLVVPNFFFRDRWDAGNLRFLAWMLWIILSIGLLVKLIAF